jgi:YD repeat-containing protein
MSDSLDLGSAGGLQTTYVYHGEEGSPHPEQKSFRLWRMRTFNGSTTHLQLEYSYDEVGNVGSLTDVSKGGQVQTFEYDDLDRLISASATGGSLPSYTRTYSYTKVGNIDDFNGRTYAYGGSGHPHAQPHAVTSAGSDTYTYDANPAPLRYGDCAAT